MDFRRAPSAATSTTFVVLLTLILPLLLLFPAGAQENVTVKSSEVHPDRTVTFRFKDATAAKVVLYLDGEAKPLPMTKNADGLWSLTTSTLPPQIYGYAFEADGQPRLDPKNPVVKPNLIYVGNSVTVPGKSPQLWDARDVPHGVVHHHFYTSKVVLGLPDGQSDYFVYTPPGYDSNQSTRYPVLYLLHGWSDLANGWTEVGQANFILDNLIANGEAKPMLVVMPSGYGDMKFVTSGDSVWGDDAAIDHNVSLFSQALLTEILPRVESEYRASNNRNDRAITGLSMGGLESLTIGLSHPQQFGWVGGFSSAVMRNRLPDKLPSLSGNSAGLHLLWIACGTEDDLITPNREFIASLKSKHVPVTAVETPGFHNWMVWRDNLAHFAPLLFQGKH